MNSIQEVYRQFASILLDGDNAKEVYAFTSELLNESRRLDDERFNKISEFVLESLVDKETDGIDYVELVATAMKLMALTVGMMGSMMAGDTEDNEVSGGPEFIAKTNMVMASVFRALPVLLSELQEPIDDNQASIN